MQTETALLVVPPSTASGVLDIPWYVASDDEPGYAIWTRCRDNWLDDVEAQSKRKNTRRAYTGDYNEFFSYWEEMIGGLLPWKVSRINAQGWVQHLRARGLADSTINRKVAALSSFYRYASDEFQYMTPEGPRGLWPHANPFGSKKLRTKVKPYSRSLPFPTAEQVQRLFMQINYATLIGKRDMALLFGMFITTRRVSEWINIRGRDIREVDGGGMEFSYLYKGGEPRKQDIPPQLWTIVQDYLKSAERWPLGPDDYVFLATEDIGRKFPNAKPDYDPQRQPLSARTANQIMKKYGKRAGIPRECLHAHALRHAGGRAYRKLGADVFFMKDLLGHSSIAVTQIYQDEVLDQAENPYAEPLTGKFLPKQLHLKFER